jgi:glutamyl/glutaminyl-tRNA synthetase
MSAAAATGGAPCSAPTVRPYVGRLAPSPTGLLHLGHARTFLLAADRARAAGGRLHLRNDDLDRSRCRPEFVAAMLEDLRWLGLEWRDPVVHQSERLALYRAAAERLHAAGAIYPCTRSRRDVLEAAGAPHEGGEHDEPIYPAAWRPPPGFRLPPFDATADVNWRFRVPDGVELTFDDALAGPQRAVAGRDFGDFVVWRRDGLPSYQLACVVDEAALGITEVVRGADLIRSTFRQQLLFGALGWPSPAYAHAPLVLDDRGERLAKRHDALSVRALRAAGVDAAGVRERAGLPPGGEGPSLAP